MKNIAVEIRNLNKSYGNLKAVQNLDIQIEQAECFGFLGPNGAGKTTTMKILYGKALPDPESQTVLQVFGMNPISQNLQVKSLMGIVPQQDNLDTALNVRDNLLVAAKFYGIDKKTAGERIESLLHFMELEEKATSKIRELSGGMQRRLTIARALINNPKLLLLDEPTTGLDPQVRHLIWNKLRELKESGVTIMLTTHYMDEAYAICDRILIMDGGKKLLEGAPRQVIHQNIEKYVMEVQGYCNANACDKLLGQGVRIEKAGDTLFAYANEMDKLVHLCETMAVEDYDIRQSNLEDVFLKVTGRSINEQQ